MRKFMYINNVGTTYGPLLANSEKEARASLRQIFGLKTTRGYYFYEKTESTEDTLKRLKNEYKEVLAANPQLCLTDFM